MSNIYATKLKVYPSKTNLDYLKLAESHYRYVYNKLIKHINILFSIHRSAYDKKKPMGLDLKRLKARLYEIIERIDTKSINSIIIDNVISLLIYKANYNINNINRGIYVDDLKYRKYTDSTYSLHFRTGFDIMQKDKNLFITIEKIGRLRCRGRIDVNYNVDNIKFITLKYNKITRELYLSINFK